VLSSTHGRVYKSDSSYTNILMGDVNNDGEVTKIDAALILKYINGALPNFKTDYNYTMTDVNNDGKTDIKDVIYILKL
jgi:hypothetical protein